MKKSGASSLERKMLSYFGLIAAASLLITVEFVYAIHEATPDFAAVATDPQAALDSAGRIEGSLRALRNKAFLMCVVQAAVTLIVLVMFMRRITSPLQHMVETATLISEGDLSRTIRIRTKDEIGLLGDTINGLTSNMQEIVTLASSVADSVSSDVKALRTVSEGNPEFRARLDEIEGKLRGFRELVADFTLFPAPPTSQKDKAA